MKKHQLMDPRSSENPKKNKYQKNPTLEHHFQTPEKMPKRKTYKAIGGGGERERHYIQRNNDTKYG